MSSRWQLPLLFSRRGDGKVQEWTIEIENNRFRTISGMTDCEKVTSEWTVCSGKNIGRSNETSPNDQACAEANAKWKKKREKGYSEQINEVDSHGLFKPMLAHNYEDHKKKLFSGSGTRVFSDPKLNGMRCIAKVDGLWTRNGKKITACPHIWTAVEPLFKYKPDAVLDGELYNHDLRHKLNRIMELVRKSILSEEDLAKAKEQIQYHIYDSIGLGDFSSSTPFSDRKGELLNLPQLLKNLTDPSRWDYLDSIKIVDSVEVSSFEELDAQYKRLLKDDWEGQMIRIDAPYQNKRTSKLLKRKEFVDEEFIVVDIVEGDGNWTGAAKSIVCRHPDGRTFNSNIKGDYEYLKLILEQRKNYIGRSATVKYFEKTEYGIPQFPFVVAFDRESVEG